MTWPMSVKPLTPLRPHPSSDDLTTRRPIIIRRCQITQSSATSVQVHSQVLRHLSTLHVGKIGDFQGWI